MDLILVLLALGIGLGAALDSGGRPPPPDDPPPVARIAPETPGPDPETGAGAEAGSGPGIARPPTASPGSSPGVAVAEPEGNAPPDPAGNFVPMQQFEVKPLEGASPAPETAPDTVTAPETAPDPTQGFAAEDQSPTGTFTTAGEVKQILSATKTSWVALRDHGGRDLLYFTQLLSWRCGLHQIRYAVNGGPAQVFPAEPCHIDTATPNAIKADGMQPYVSLPRGLLDTVEITVLYDDLTTNSARFARAEILMP